MRHRLLCALAFACFAVVIAPVGAAADPPLSLDRTSGISGTLVTVTPGLTKPSPCVLELDGTQVQTFTCGPEVSVGLAVSGPPGPHTIEVCADACVTGNPAESATFVIKIAVPSLTGQTLAEATKGLLGDHLTMGQVSGVTGDPAVTVSAQFPAIGALVDAGTPVDLTLGSVAPTLVVVPYLNGLTVSRATDVLRPLGLIILARSSHGYVVGQDPPAHTRVPPKSVVTVTVRANRPRLRLVTVPEVRGDSLAGARQAMRRAGLVLSTTATSGTVATQSLAPGRRVPPGSTVSVTFQPVSAGPTRTVSASLPGRYRAFVEAAVIVLLLAASLVAGHARKRRRPRRRPTGPLPHVSSRPTGATVDMRSLRPDPRPDVELHTRHSTTLTIRRKP